MSEVLGVVDGGGSRVDERGGGKPVRDRRGLTAFSVCTRARAKIVDTGTH